jgi:hypothetical protein
MDLPFGLPKGMTRLLWQALVDREDGRSLKFVAWRDRVTVTAIQHRRERAARICGIKLVRPKHPRRRARDREILCFDPATLDTLPCRPKE